MRDAGLLESTLARPVNRAAYLLDASDQAAVIATLQLAEGTMTEEAFAAWLRENSIPFEE